MDETADALDSMMEATLAHVDARLDRGEAAAVSDTLLRVFVGTLLPAHRSKFTQFLLFHACARDAAAIAAAESSARGGAAGGGAGTRAGGAAREGGGGGWWGTVSRGVLGEPSATVGAGAGAEAGTKGGFGIGSGGSGGRGVGLGGGVVRGVGLTSRVVDVMIERLTDPYQALAGRLAAAAYLASFLARAKFLGSSFLAATLHRLAAWCCATVAGRRAMRITSTLNPKP